MMQRLGPQHVGDETYRIVEATMMNTAKRICSYDWYNAARSGGVDMPDRMRLRDYGRECALAYIEERGYSIHDAVRAANRLVYHRAYDDARGYVTNSGGKGRHRINATTSIAETHTIDTTYWDDVTRDGGWYETCDLIQRLPFPNIDKQILAWIALGYTPTETAEQVGMKRTTLTMRLPRIVERVRRVWSTDESLPWATSL